MMEGIEDMDLDQLIDDIRTNTSYFLMMKMMMIGRNVVNVKHGLIPDVLRVILMMKHIDVF